MRRIFHNFFFILLIAAYVNGGKRLRRLANADDADIKNFPYMAGIKYNETVWNSNLLSCGGSIIGPNKILTTASCIKRCLKSLDKEHEKHDCKNLMTVVTGATNLSESGDIYNVKSFKIHEQYDSKLRARDVGIITLSSNIKFKDNVKTISLPDKDIVVNSLAITAGWGKFNDEQDFEISEILKSLNETIISSKKCAEHYKNPEVDSSNFCASPIREKSGSCAGDAGNPLIQDGKIIGISSFGIGCGEGYPDIFVNVYKHLDFIKRELA